jgi:hypothetical protein
MENRASEEHPLALFFRELTERLRLDPYLNIENGYLHAELKRLRSELATAKQEWTGPFEETSEEYWYNTASKLSTWIPPLRAVTVQVEILERLSTELGQTDDASPPVASGRRLRLKSRTSQGSSDVSACEKHSRSRRSRKQVGSPTSPDSPETPETAPETPETLATETSPLLG